MRMMTQITSVNGHPVGFRSSTPSRNASPRSATGPCRGATVSRRGPCRGRMCRAVDQILRHNTVAHGTEHDATQLRHGTYLLQKFMTHACHKFHLLQDDALRNGVNKLLKCIFSQLKIFFRADRKPMINNFQCI